MRGTILKVRTATGDVFWQVPASGDVVTKGSQAAAEYKLSVNKTGNDIAGTMTKLSELSTATHVVTHAIRGVLRAASGNEGEHAKLTVAGVAAWSMERHSTRLATSPSAPSSSSSQARRATASRG